MSWLISEYDDGQFYTSGVLYGEISKYFLNYQPELSSFEADKDQMAPAIFIAGWYDGLTQH